MINRKKTRLIKIGNIPIGDNNPVVIQSMTNTKTKMVNETLLQIKQLSSKGAEIVRVALLDMEDAEKLKEIILHSPVPIVADIHFDYQLALKSIEAGVSGLRINPGNIKEKGKLALIAEKATIRNIPIRIGVNAGSLDKLKYSQPSPLNMVKSALEHIKMLEDLGFYQIKVSLKSSEIQNMIEANRIFAEEREYPLHLGVTEAGTLVTSAVRSAMGIGTLLLEGIGDTIRVSVAGNPIKELKIAKEILISLGLRKGIKFIACPTCGRTEIDVEGLTLYLEDKLESCNKNLTIAVMGCVVNGPGEAREADIAVVGGKNESNLYIKGDFFKKVRNEELLGEINQFIKTLTSVDK